MRIGELNAFNFRLFVLYVGIVEDSKANSDSKLLTFDHCCSLREWPQRPSGSLFSFTYRLQD